MIVKIKIESGTGQNKVEFNAKVTDMIQPIREIAYNFGILWCCLRVDIYLKPRGSLWKSYDSIAIIQPIRDIESSDIINDFL